MYVIRGIIVLKYTPQFVKDTVQFTPNVLFSLPFVGYVLYFYSINFLSDDRRHLSQAVKR